MKDNPFSKLGATIPEPLCDELKECIITEGKITVIHHPMLIAFPPPEGKSLEAAFLNSALAGRREAYEAELLDGDFEAAIMVYVTRPYRTSAFDMYSDEMSDEDYWELLSTIWVDQENPEDFTDEWRIRFSADRAHRELMMLPYEQEAFSLLPDKITIYRAALAKEVRGLSWTTDLNVAKMFSRRLGQEIPIYTAKVNKNKVTAYWTRRNEQELLILDSDAITDLEEVKWP